MSLTLGCWAESFKWLQSASNTSYLSEFQLAEESTHVSLQCDAARLHLLELAAVMPATDCFLHQQQLLGQHTVPLLL